MARKTKAERKAARKALVKKIKKAITAPARAVEAAVLIPFRPMLERAIKEKGEQPESKMSKLAEQFHRLVVRGENMEECVEQFGNNFDQDSYIDDLENAEEGGAEGGGKDAVKDIAKEALPGIVKAIMAWIQKAREKRAAGKELSKAEKNAVDAADTVGDATKDAIKEGAQFEIGKFVTSPTGLGVIAVVVVGGFLLLRKK